MSRGKGIYVYNSAIDRALTLVSVVSDKVFCNRMVCMDHSPGPGLAGPLKNARS